MATALSKVNNIIWEIIKIFKKNKFIDGPLFPRRVNNKWPAIILAVNRIANVIGRIIFLIDSMHTINGIKIDGVPWGTKCINMCCE